MIDILSSGRLGNQMFQYAAVRSIAEKNGYGFHFDSKHWLGRNLFDIDLGSAKAGICKYEFREGDKYDPAIWNIKDGTMLMGYFQGEKYFSHDKTRQWFRPKFKIVADYSSVCYAHFRGGDYNVFPWNMWQLQVPYYNEAKQKMLQIQPGLRFVVITDDRQAAQKRFPDDEIISDSVERDFVLLNSARYLIICNSSFSWWTAWLNPDNIVIAPQGWNNYYPNKEVFSPAELKVDRFIWI
jgi:hypothetical protein